MFYYSTRTFDFFRGPYLGGNVDWKTIDKGQGALRNGQSPHHHYALFGHLHRESSCSRIFGMALEMISGFLLLGAIARDMNMELA